MKEEGASDSLSSFLPSRENSKRERGEVEADLLRCEDGLRTHFYFLELLDFPLLYHQSGRGGMGKI